MTTNQLGPLVAGRDEEKVTAASGPRARRGRDPGVVRLEPRLLLGRAASGARSRTSSRRCWRSLSSSLGGPRDRAGWLALVAVVAVLARLHLDHPRQLVRRRRNGGEPLLPEPAAGLPVPRAARAGRGGWRAGAVVAAAVFLAPVLASPVAHSLRPGDHATRGAFQRPPGRADDAQRPLRLHGDLAQEAPLRLRRQPASGRPTRTPTSSTSWTTARSARRSGRAAPASGSAGGASAEVVLRAFDLAPVERVVLRVAGGPLGDTVTRSPRLALARG